MNKIDWKRKLTSRKLWVSLANFVSMLYIYFGHAVSDGEKIAAIILAGGTLIGYVIGEGLADSGDTNNYQAGALEAFTEDDNKEV